MVGKRYRDLIGAADNIVQMASSAAEVSVDKFLVSWAHPTQILQVVGALNHVERLCTESLDNTQKTNGVGYGADEKSRFYGVALQMKMLVDTPELVWSALERQDHMTVSI